MIRQMLGLSPQYLLNIHMGLQSLSFHQGILSLYALIKYLDNCNTRQVRCYLLSLFLQFSHTFTKVVFLKQRSLHIPSLNKVFHALHCWEKSMSLGFRLDCEYKLCYLLVVVNLRKTVLHLLSLVFSTVKWENHTFLMIFFIP